MEIIDNYYNKRTLIKEDKNRAIFNEILPELPIREKTQLQRLLDEKII